MAAAWAPGAAGGATPAKLGGRWVRVVRGLEFGEASAYLLLPAWTYRLRIVAAGTNTVVKDLARSGSRAAPPTPPWRSAS